MVDQDKKDLPEQAGEINPVRNSPPTDPSGAQSAGEIYNGVKVPEKKTLSSADVEHFDWHKEKKVEDKEISPYDKIVSGELRREIEMMELDDATRAEAEKKALKIEFLGEKEKIEHLLKMAKEKGIVFAIQVAKKMNEPYLLDILHDTLAQEGFYLKMGQQTNDDNDDKKT
ncbi:MAG: hypothetical protein NT094_00315 [Candidatus Staskawiczbacteria bacterium]|nr:hypothetical protein [Candidatus Staskawiczbacteria bacterium]